MTPDAIARFRVPVGWLLGLLALWAARPRGEYLLAGVLVAAVGESLRLWASGYLEKDRRLATAGPYAWTRNPLYLGSFFVGAGFALATGRLLVLVALIVLFAAIYFPVMKREASRLALAFPDDYSRYASQVPLLVPRIPRRDASPSGSFSWSRVVANREPTTVVGLVLVVAILWGKWMLFGS
jgi:protein-S-isoprenylcysteine O-methyltransferase Ste14